MGSARVAGGRTRSILVTRDDGVSAEIEPDIMEAATVEVLRACIFAAEVVLIPATVGLLPIAAVIAHDIRQTVGSRDEKLRFRTGRFVPITWDRDTAIESLRPFLQADLGGSVRDIVEGHVLPVTAALAEYPPAAVVALTVDEITMGLLRYSLDQTLPIWYFRSLVGARAKEFAASSDPLSRRFVDLEREMPRIDERDKESGRSDDEGLEPFVPFGLLLQEVLWPAEPPQR
jgi:hypothetical protein